MRRESDRDNRRSGDKRPLRANPKVSLTFFPAHDEPFRWLPKHGEPLCIGEWMSQHVIKMIAWLPVYTAIVVTAILVIVWFTRGGISP